MRMWHVTGILCAALGLGSLHAQVPAKAAGCFSILVPSYFSPKWDAKDWNELVASKPPAGCGERVLILNPYNGPAERPDPSFQAVVKQAQKAGEKVYGYIRTDYAKIPMATIQSQLERYVKWYGVDGIFIDEVSWEAEKARTYYQPVVTLVTHAVPGVVLNPGIYPDEAYARLSVPPAAHLQIVVFEHDEAAFTASTFAEPAWAKKYPASEFVQIVYAVKADQVSHVLDLAKQRNTGWVYITDENLPNPYSRLPPYWGELNEEVQSGCRPGFKANGHMH